MPRRREERRGFLIVFNTWPQRAQGLQEGGREVRLRGPGTCTRSVGRESTPEKRRVRGKGPRIGYGQGQEESTRIARSLGRDREVPLDFSNISVR